MRNGLPGSLLVRLATGTGPLEAGHCRKLGECAMATIYRIHPAIGIARVGTAHRVLHRPERIGQFPDPQRFKDSQCRVKRRRRDSAFMPITMTTASKRSPVPLPTSADRPPSTGRQRTVSLNTEPDADLTIDPGREYSWCQPAAVSTPAPSASPAFRPSCRSARFVAMSRII